MACGETAGVGAGAAGGTFCEFKNIADEKSSANQRRRKLVIAPDCSARAVYNRCMRPQFDWKLRSRSLKLGERTLIMGIVNVTPDSFSDGGEFLEPQRAVDHALAMGEEGADILDIGGESTRPGKRDRVTAEEEKRRVLPVIEGILREAPEAILSLDTYKAETAEAALAAGVEIVNDVSGFTWDEQMLSVLAAKQCGCVLMHTRGRPEDWKSLPPLSREQVLPLVLSDLRRLSDRATLAGIARERIVLDPGFGFGKRMDENFPLVGRLAELHRLGFPLLSGTSRKSFVTRASSADLSEDACSRLAGSLASLSASVLQGAHIVRVHDVKPSLKAATIADAILVSRS
jgi:dihydropteroate synthase